VSDESPDEPLAVELLALVARDDAVRARLLAEGSLFEGYHPEMEAVHRANAARLRELIGIHGWPGRGRVGPAAAHAAWRIVQHAIGEPEFLRAMLPIVAEDPETPRAEVAMLEDRIRVFEGKLQRYGTQFDWNDEGTALVPMVGVEDAVSVDERRESVGLPPMVWRRQPGDGERPPRDPAAKRRAAEAWLRRVGWR
jgi:hypothetical protein